MKLVARIAMVVALLIGGIVQPIWCQENVDQYVKELNSKTEDALKKLDLQQSAILAEQAYRYTTEHLDQKHPETLKAESNIVALYYYQGRYKEAEVLCRKNFQLRKEVLGYKHKDTLESMANLAEIYTSIGNYRKSEPLNINALRFRREILGGKHPDTIVSINNLAHLYHLQGFSDKAESLYRNGLQLSKETLGQDHTHMIGLMANLAELYKQQSRYKEAESLLKQSLQSSEKVFGKDHQVTINLMYKLSGVYYSQGMRNEAAELIGNTIKIDKNIIEEISSKSVGLFKEALKKGDQQEIVKSLIVLLEKKRSYSLEHFGEDNNETINYTEELSMLYAAEGLYDKAELLLKQVVQVRENMLGKEHPESLKSMNKLANLYSLHGKAKADEDNDNKAIALADETYEYALSHFGYMHPYTSDSYEKLLKLYQRYERVRDWEILYMYGWQYGSMLKNDKNPNLKKWENLYAKSRVPSTPNSNSNQVVFAGEQAYDYAIKYLGEEHPAVLISIEQLLVLYYSVGFFKKYELICKKAIKTQEKLFGSEDYRTLYFRQELVKLYAKMGRVNQAEIIAVDVLLLRKKVLGSEHTDTLQSISQLALLYLAQGRKQDAEPLMKDLLYLYKKIYGTRHGYTKESLDKLVDFYLSQGRRSDANQLLHDFSQDILSFLCTSKATDKDSEYKILRSESQLAYIYQRQRRYQEAEALFKKAIKGIDNNYEHKHDYATLEERARFDKYVFRIKKIQRC